MVGTIPVGDVTTLLKDALAAGGLAAPEVPMGCAEPIKSISPIRVGR